MDLETRMARLEKRVDQYRKTTVVLALLLVAGLTMGQAKRPKDGNFDTVICRKLLVKSDKDVIQVGLFGEPGQAGQILVKNAKGDVVVSVFENSGGYGSVWTNQPGP